MAFHNFRDSWLIRNCVTTISITISLRTRTTMVPPSKSVCWLTSMYFLALWSRAKVVSLSGRGTCCLSTSRQSRNWARLKFKRAIIQLIHTYQESFSHWPVLLQKIVSSTTGGVWVGGGGEIITSLSKQQISPQVVKLTFLGLHSC